ncbi:MAG: DUF2156 domain-containing protein [Ruminococcaceae bacterium]|nr:DUF2156 domain-containing protein [Oscillospiraceae bacterium]
MNYSFKAVDYEGLAPMTKVIGDVPFNFCDFTPYVIFTWQKYYDTHYALIDDALVLRHNIDGELCYAPLAKDILSVAEKLVSGEESVSLSPLCEADVKKLTEKYEALSIECDDAWSDYIYLHSDLAELAGKRYSGQRNHINKFLQSNPDWSYEEVNDRNIQEVFDFYKELTQDVSFSEGTAIYEHRWLEEYFDGGVSKLPLAGGVIRAGGRILSLAFGEVIGETLYVHIEKARRDVQGAYQMTVREFARHNPATFINREEDMGIEGLRRSKLSYHPTRLERKYKIRIKAK